jgi:uncharacterized protein (TIGR02588 family)
MTDSQSGGERRARHPVTALEVIATTIAGLLVALLVGVLIWNATHPDTPAQLSVEPRSVQLDASGYRLPVTVRNRGDKSAKDVVVHMTLVSVRTDSTIDESEITIDWLPRQSSREVVGMFARRSNGEQIGVRAEVRGYVVP